MALPKVVLAIPLIAVGAATPGLTRHVAVPGRPNVVGMRQEGFDREVITIHRGQRVELVNNSNFLHVVAPGHRARVSNGAGVPTFGPDNLVSMSRGRPYVTAAWMTTGSFQLTCTLHPEMNLTVVVDD
jgi:plastocyanin